MFCPLCNRATPRFWKGSCQGCYNRIRIKNNPAFFKELYRKRHAKHSKQRTEYAKNWNNSHKDVIAKRMWEKQGKIDAIKINQPCMDCGNTFPPECMDFDHRPGTQKISSISKLGKRTSWKKIEAEIAKCDIVCANCHRIRTKARWRVNPVILMPQVQKRTEEE